MSILSMTGFGLASLPSPLGLLTAEIRTVNNRFLELSLRMPDELRLCESSIRELIGRAVPRGKLELKLSLGRSETLPALQLNDDRLQQLLALGEKVRAQAPANSLAPWSLTELLRWPGVLQGSSTDDSSGPSSAEGTAAMLSACEAVVTAALQSLAEARAREGSRLAQVMLDKLDRIEAHVAQAQSVLPEAVAAVREKIVQKLQEAFEGVIEGQQGEALQQALHERIRQEAHAAALRADIAEEIDRLRTHLTEMRSILRQPKESAVGKRLDFLTQELHRESNTLGSKSASLTTTQIALELKLLVEQIREQVQNVQ